MADHSPVTELNLLTLNCWGLLHLSALRQPRLASIGRHIAALSPPPDVVALQECWTQEDYRAVRRETRLVLPYGKFYHGGAFGAGLAILSRWPIEDSSMVPYPLNGRPTAFWRGDWYVGKGVACASIRFGPGEKDVMEVFNTHTHAPYEKEPNDSYLCHRTAQAWHISKLLRGASLRGHLVVALGDFNMLPLSLAHRLITAHAPVRDVWRVLHPDSSLGPADHPAERARRRPVPDAAFNVRENGATSDTVYNTWRWTKTMQNKVRGGDACAVPPDTPDPKGKRLDYIFAGTGSSQSEKGTPSSGWVVKSANVDLMDRHPDLHVSLSDHFAVRATLSLHTPSPTSSLTSSQHQTSETTALLTGAYLAPGSPSGSSHGDHPSASDPATWTAQLREARSVDTSSLPLPVYDEILAVVRTYAAREHRQRYWRGVHFYAAVAVWVGCLVAVWFVPVRFGAFLLMLLASLSLAAGVIDGLLALLFFSAEIRSLKEFEWEIRNAKAAASGDMGAVDDVEVYARTERKKKRLS